MAKADPMTDLLSLAVGGSMQSQMEAKLASMNIKSPRLIPSSPSTHTLHTSTNRNYQSPAFNSTSSFLSPKTANTLGNLSDGAHTLAQQRANSMPPATPHIAFPRWPSPRAQESAARGLVAVHSANSWSAATPPHKIYLSGPSRPTRRAPTILASPPARRGHQRHPLAGVALGNDSSGAAPCPSRKGARRGRGRCSVPRRPSTSRAPCLRRPPRPSHTPSIP